MSQKRTEHVTLGTERIGTIRITDLGFETFGPHDEYLCTHIKVADARRSLFELHRDSEKGLATS